MPPALERFRVDHQPISYEARGAGPSVLLLHAFPLGLGMWEPQVAALAADHRVIRFDDRGFGGSPPADGPLTMDRIADDAAALLDHLRVARAVVCGLSMGGYAALAFARRHGDRLSGLVLADTRAGADSPEAREVREAQAERVLAEGPEALADDLLARLLAPSTRAASPQVVAAVRAMILAASRRGIAGALRGMAARPDSRPHLGTIRVPTLVLCGDEDTLTPMSEAEALAEAIVGSRLTAVPRAGHLSNLESPEDFNAALRGFLASLA